MIKLLIKTFVKDYSDVKNPQVRESYGVFASIVNTVCNVFLFAAKLSIGLISNSIGIIADAFNNLSDVGGNVVTFFGFRLASAEPDEDHPFGHGRIEYIASLIIAFLILMVAVEILKTSVSKIIHPEAVEFSLVTITVLVLSIFVKLWMGRLNGFIGKEIDSTTMRAVAMDSLSDCFSTGVATLGIIISYFFSINIDGYLGVIVGLFILKSGIDVAKDTLVPLLGTHPDEELVKEIEDILLSFPIITGIHDLILHDYGPTRQMGSVHAEVPHDCNILYAHDIVDSAEKLIAKRLSIPFVIHFDPVATDNAEANALKIHISEIVKTIDEKMTIHDFRIVVGQTHTNIIFDVMVPHSYKEKNITLKKEIDRLIKNINPTYFTVITFDRSYI